MINDGSKRVVGGKLYDRYKMSAFEIDDGELINCMRQFPFIYDKNHGDYRNKNAKRKAWIRVGQIMGVSEELCEQRWGVIRNRFATELRNRKKNPSGAPTPSSWRLYQAMQFLEEYISPRKTRGGLASLVDKHRKFPSPHHDIKVEKKSPQSASSQEQQLLTLELRSTSPTLTTATTKLRPIAPRPVPTATVTRLVTVATSTSNDSPTVTSAINQSISNCTNRHAECHKEKYEVDDEDILFGKSIGHSLRNIRNKRIKLQIKSEILSIIAQHSD